LNKILIFIRMKQPINEIKRMQQLAGILTENEEKQSFEDFIQSNGGTLDALKFQHPEDVENEIEKIRDDFQLGGIHVDDLDGDIFDDATFKFEEIYGINPITLIQFLGDDKYKQYKF